MATAELREKQALLKANKNDSEVYRAQIEAAEARVELAQLDLDRCTLRAPFAGRVSALPACAGQYVMKGTILAELADVSSLKVMQPVDRRSVAPNSSFSVQIEGRDVPAKVQAVLPLPESMKILRELVTPLSAATLIVANSKGELEPGLAGSEPDRSHDSDRDCSQTRRQVRRLTRRWHEHDGAGHPRRLRHQCPGAGPR